MLGINMTTKIMLTLEVQFTTSKLTRERESIGMNGHMGLELSTRREGLGTDIASIGLDDTTSSSRRGGGSSRRGDRANRRDGRSTVFTLSRGLVSGQGRTRGRRTTMMMSVLLARGDGGGLLQSRLLLLLELLHRLNHVRLGGDIVLKTSHSQGQAQRIKEREIPILLCLLLRLLLLLLLVKLCNHPVVVVQHGHGRRIRIAERRRRRRDRSSRGGAIRLFIILLEIAVGAVVILALVVLVQEIQGLLVQENSGVGGGDLSKELIIQGRAGWFGEGGEGRGEGGDTHKAFKSREHVFGTLFLLLLLLLGDVLLREHVWIVGVLCGIVVVSGLDLHGMM